MKILILVLSYTQWPFDEFMKAQQETWGRSDQNIDVVYYYGGDHTSDWWFRGELMLNCSDAYNLMHYKFKLALDAIDYHKYDMIFRTNSCSYIVKHRILEVAKSLPRIGCYSGWLNHDCVSGAGIFMTPDVLDVLRSELTDEPFFAEDVLIYNILKDRYEVIDDKSRIDAQPSGVERTNGYHFRFKTSNDPEQRQRDIDNMRKLHNTLTA